MRITTYVSFILTACLILGVGMAEAGSTDADAWQAAAAAREETAEANQSVAGDMLIKADALSTNLCANAEERRDNCRKTGEYELASGDLESAAGASYLKAADNWERAARCDGVTTEYQASCRQSAAGVRVKALIALRSAETAYNLAVDVFSDENGNSPEMREVALRKANAARSAISASEDME